jgi:hypothetical protein
MNYFAFGCAVALLGVACGSDDTGETSGSGGSGASASSASSGSASGGSTSASTGGSGGAGATGGGGAAATGTGGQSSSNCSPPCGENFICCPGGAADVYYCNACPPEGCMAAECPPVP